MTVLATAVPLGTTPFSIQAQNQAVILAEAAPYEANLKLDISYPQAVADTDSVSVFKPGDSKIQLADQEKAQEIARQNAERAAREAAAREAVARMVISRETARDDNRNESVNVNLKELYARVGSRFGVDPRILEAIHQVESGKSVYTARVSDHGATGPMQFLPSTFRRHAVDGNGDGVTDIMNVEDAVFTAARYLVDCGYDGTEAGIKKAIFGYNPSYSYYYKIMDVAHSIGF